MAEGLSLHYFSSEDDSRSSRRNSQGSVTYYRPMGRLPDLPGSPSESICGRAERFLWTGDGKPVPAHDRRPVGLGSNHDKEQLYECVVADGAASLPVAEEGSDVEGGRGQW